MPLELQTVLAHADGFLDQPGVFSVKNIDAALHSICVCFASGFAVWDYLDCDQSWIRRDVACSRADRCLCSRDRPSHAPRDSFSLPPLTFMRAHMSPCTHIVVAVCQEGVSIEPPVPAIAASSTLNSSVSASQLDVSSNPSTTQSRSKKKRNADADTSKLDVSVRRASRRKVGVDDSLSQCCYSLELYDACGSFRRAHLEIVSPNEITASTAGANGVLLGDITGAISWWQLNADWSDAVDETTLWPPTDDSYSVDKWGGVCSVRILSTSTTSRAVATFMHGEVVVLDLTARSVLCVIDREHAVRAANEPHFRSAAALLWSPADKSTDILLFFGTKLSRQGTVPQWRVVQASADSTVNDSRRQRSRAVSHTLAHIVSTDAAVLDRLPTLFIQWREGDEPPALSARCIPSPSAAQLALVALSADELRDVSVMDCIATSTAGALMAAVCAASKVVLFDALTGAVRASIQIPNACALRFVNDHVIAVATDAGRVLIVRM